MNKRRREKLSSAMALLGKASDVISSVLYEEQDCIYNIPENLQGSERGMKMEKAVEELSEAIEYITNARESITEATE